MSNIDGPLKLKDSELNAIPSLLLKSFNSNHGYLLCRDDLSLGPVTGCSSHNPADLIPLNNFKAIDLFRRKLGVHSILVCVVRVTTELALKLEPLFPEFKGIFEEVNKLINKNGEVLAVYVVTHFNAGPCRSLTVSIGGDCYREDQANLYDVIERTSLLAKTMCRKAVMMLPTIPALHGGKKGEWILLDKQGRAIQGVSEATRIAFGSVVIKDGIEFINRFKNEKLNEEIKEESDV